jgi:hypothetical protein
MTVCCMEERSTGVKISGTTTQCVPDFKRLTVDGRTWSMSPTPRPDASPSGFLLLLFFPALLLQVYPSTLLAAQNASGWFSPHCDGASFYLSKVGGLPSGQKLNLNMRHYGLPWWNYRPQEVWEDVSAERCFAARKCEAATRARIWLDKGDAKDKRVSGKYDVDFGGQHLEGKFLVKYRKQDWICE